MSGRAVLLSELYQKGRVTNETIEKYRDLITDLVKKEKRTEEEDRLVADFLATIVDVKLTAANKLLPPRLTTEGGTSAGTKSQPDQGVPQIIKLNELVVVPEKFDGSPHKARKWLDDYIRAATSNSWNFSTMTKYFQTYLTGTATDWYAVTGSNNNNWTDLLSSFCRYYIGRDENLSLERQIRDAQQKQNETSTSFISRYARLATIADPNISQEKMVNAIRIRLRPEIMERLTSHHLIYNLEDLSLACISIEDNLRALRLTDRSRKESKSNTKNERSDKPYNKSRNRKDKQDTKNKKSSLTCYRCRRPGHKKEDCFATKDSEGKELKDAPPKKPPPRKKVNAVDTWEDEEPPVIITTKRCSTIIANSRIKQRPSLILHELEIGGVKLKALIDTGSEISLINSEMSSLNGWIPQGPIPELAGADNSIIKCYGCVKLDCKITLNHITKEAKSVRFTVTENLCADAIIGLGLLGWFKILIDPENKSLVFKQDSKNLTTETPEILPPRSQKIISAVVPYGIVGSIQTVPFDGGRPDLMIANTIDEVKQGRIKCLIINLDNRPKELNRGWPLASYEQLVTEQLRVNSTMEIADTQSFVTVGDQLDENQLTELRGVLEQNKAAFSIDGELGCTNALEHDIELIEGAKPFAEPLRRRPIAHQEETRRQIKQMLEQGIIEESNSPWAAAYVLAKKKSGELRLCVDFRRLNDATKKCVYPLPNVEDCIDTLAGKKYFSQLDMASGFWQLPLTSRAKELTSFRTEDGQYQFTRMPFGLTNAPASFQRLVNIVFSGLKGLNLQVFIDDLCIASNSWSEHINSLKDVFKLLIKANLKLKSNKCTFGVPKVIFLGHEISADGIRQDPSKLAALRSLPSPTNLKELRSSMGMLNYYRKFVPKFAIITEPITRLTKKSETFNWQDEQERAFRNVLNVLLSNGTLTHYDRKAPTALKTDACKIGIAAILLQQYEGEWKLVTCRSRRLKPNESNYGITELEALAIVEAVVKLRNYLLGIKFRIITDHCALCLVFKNKSTNSRLNRWRWILQEFDFEVIYTKGTMHSDVDCLSRSPINDEIDDFLDDRVMTTYCTAAAVGLATQATPVNRNEWREIQNTDEEAKKFATKAKHRRDGYKYVEGLLYKNNRLYVPELKRKSLLEASHNSPIAAHGGIKATLSRLDAFWWPTLSKDVTDWCNSCQTCQQRKISRERPSGQMRSFDARAPLDLIAIDCLDLQESMNHRKHVIVAVDVFTRFVSGKAIKNLKSSCFEKFLLEFIGRFGIPNQILTDNAPIFVNESVKELTLKFNIDHRKSTPHHHEGNAVAERMIQTVQEKLALLINDDNESIDWDAALPRALLAINTAVCNSTGFSPYELMFARKHALLHAELELRDRLMESQLNARQNDLASITESANVNQLANKLTSKQRFDKSHRNVTFEEGEKVWARKMGRLSKLSNKWNGPYVITKKDNDIYSLLCDKTHKSIERHVRDMKRFVQINVIIWVATIWTTAQQPSSTTTGSQDFPSLQAYLQKSSPIQWQETDKFVSPGHMSMKFRITWTSPCPLLRSIPDVTQEVESAVIQCETYYQNDVINRVASLVKGSATSYAPPILPQQVVPASYQPETNQVKPSQYSQNVNQQGQYHQGQYYQPQGAIPQNQPQQVPPQTYGRKKRDVKDSLQLRRVKREWGLTTAFATYAIVSNVVKRIIDRYWPEPAVQELNKRQEQIQSSIDQLTQRQNISELMHEAVSNALENQANLIQYNSAEISRIAFTHPELMVVSGHLMAKLVQMGSYIDRLKIAFRARRPDLSLLSLITDTDFLDTVDQDTIPKNSVDLTAINNQTIEVRFVARIVDRTTSVYDVDAFDFWVNITEVEASKMHYGGPMSLIYNHSIGCVKGVTGIKHRWVNAHCLIPNFVDMSLSSWSILFTSKDPWESRNPVVVKESWPFINVNCLSHNITVHGVTGECPPWIFSINATVPFKISDGFSYSYQAMEYKVNVEMSIAQIAAIHFRNQPFDIDETFAIKEIRRLRKDLGETKEKLYVMSWREGGGISYFQVLLALGGMGALCGIGYVLHDTKKTNDHRHKEIRKIVMESAYGSRLYETIDHASHRRSRSVRAMNTRSPTTVINMHGIPTTGEPLPKTSSSHS